VALLLSTYQPNKKYKEGKFSACPHQELWKNCIAEMKSACDEWKPFIVMIASDFSFAVVNVLLKKVLEEGVNHLVFITYRLTIATIFIAPVAYFRERLVHTISLFSLAILFCGVVKARILLTCKIDQIASMKDFELTH